MAVSPCAITLKERRPIEGLDGYIPIILRDGAPYDDDLDKFFLDLPLNGVRSSHSLRAYGYDIVVWVRFLEQACGKALWDATPDDIIAFHRARRRGRAENRISAASWNRCVAALEKLYQWAIAHRRISVSPFRHTEVLRRSHTEGRGRIVARNNAFERAAKQSNTQFVSLEDYRRFRDVGLRGLDAHGAERAGARDRNSLRNALFAELLVLTGLRLEEASCLLAFEIEAPTQIDCLDRQIWLELPDGLAKGNRARAVLLPAQLLQQLRAYITVERTHALKKFAARDGSLLIEQPIFIRPLISGARKVTLQGGDRVPLAALTPAERQRLVICDADGAPLAPAVLWVTEAGQPVRPNSWEAAFARASQRCRANDHPINVSPHKLRHTFAVYMLAMLIQQHLRHASPMPTGAGAEVYRRVLGDPLQQVQRLLGHASLATTSIYLDHIITRAETVDAAVDELLALLPGAGRT